MRKYYVAFILVLLLILPISDAHAQTNSAVRAVLFYSPTCGHCQYVIGETILPLLEKYGERLQVLGLDVTQPATQPIYTAAMDKFGLEQSGVPFLVIDEIYLVGSVDIPEKFPGLIESYLAQGGVDWPDIPGLPEAIAGSGLSDAPTASSPHETILPAVPVPASPTQAVTIPTNSPIAAPSDVNNVEWRERFSNDPAGNTLALIVLAGMLVALMGAQRLFHRSRGLSIRGNWAWLIPCLSLFGLVIAGYLAYLEVYHVTAVCGPVGDCNTVQQSEYARLFGILPIGVLGMLGYSAIILAWSLGRSLRGRPANLAVLSLFGMALLGTLFSIYLTFIEPFVIGATCAWCLSSALLMTLLMLLSVRPAKRAILYIANGKEIKR